MYPELFAELLRSGHWTVADLKKVAGLNLLRVFAKVEKVGSIYILTYFNVSYLDFRIFLCKNLLLIQLKCAHNTF
ncbi:Dipeptidase 1 [Blattella germanica]|nr:Dipeptidase 1 [Blattella germanica]